MPFQESQIGMPCPFCTTGTLMKYKSGKIGCNKICWKNNPTAPKMEKVEPKSFSQAPNQNQTQQGQIIFIDKFEEVLGALDFLKESIGRIEAIMGIVAKKIEEVPEKVIETYAKKEG